MSVGRSSQGSRHHAEQQQQQQQHQHSKQHAAVSLGLWEIFYRLRYLLLYTAMSVVEFVMVGPSLQYIIMTFFARHHGGGDCALNPSSDPCRAASSDAAVYVGISSGFCGIVGTFFAIGLGTLSDRIGRHPVLVVRTWLSLLPIVALALYQFFGMSLWAFLIAGPIFKAFDVSGVLLAVVADVIREPSARACALGLWTTWSITTVIIVLPMAGFLPIQAAVSISLAATVLKVIYIHAVMPESWRAPDDEAAQANLDEDLASATAAASSTPSSGRLLRWWRGGPSTSLSTTNSTWSWRAATPSFSATVEVLTRHYVIFRMAVVLIFSSLSGAGMHTLASPYLTGYLGITRQTSVAVLLVAVGSGIVGLALGIRTLIRAVGEVVALQICLGPAILTPLLLSACVSTSQVVFLALISGAPLFMLMPIISSIKSKLVREDEQGLIQGALAGICNFSTALADVGFGFLYKFFTQGGLNPDRTSVLPLFCVCSGLGAISWGLSLSLPRHLPEPEAKRKPLLGDDYLSTRA